MQRASRRTLLAALVSTLFVGACALVFQQPLGQHLDVSFRLEEPLTRGERHAVGTWTLEQGLDTRRRFLQLSGAIARPPGAPLPRRIEVLASVTDPATERVSQRLRLTAEITPEDRFRVGKRIGRDIEPGQRIDVTVEPSGDDLPAGTEVRLCLDLVRKRGDLRAFPSCAVGRGASTFAEIQTAVWTPSCATAGCHDSTSSAAGLDLEEGRAHASLVGVPSSQIFRRLRVDPGRPDESYLVQKIRGSSAINGGRMPLGGPFLSADQIAGIVEWVENGARDD